MDLHIVPGVTSTFQPLRRNDCADDSEAIVSSSFSIISNHSSTHAFTNDGITEGGFGTIQVVKGPMTDDDTTDNTMTVGTIMGKFFSSSMSLLRPWPLFVRFCPQNKQQQYRRCCRVIKRYKRCKNRGLLSFDFLREVNMYAILGRRHPNIAQVDVVDLWPDASLSCIMSDISRHHKACNGDINMSKTDSSLREIPFSNSQSDFQSQVSPPKQTWINSQDICSWILRRWNNVYHQHHNKIILSSPACCDVDEPIANDGKPYNPTNNNNNSADIEEGSMAEMVNESSGASILLRYYRTTLFDMIIQTHEQQWSPTNNDTCGKDIVQNTTTDTASDFLLEKNDDMDLVAATPVLVRDQSCKSPISLLSLSDVCHYMNDIITGLVEIYRHGFSYSDLKLENVLMHWDPICGRYRCSLCDMGAVEFVYHDILSERTEDGSMGKRQQVDFAVISPGSCPPEILCGLTYIDPIKSDMWMLGILMASMLLGTVNVLDRSACDTVTGELDQIFDLIGTPSRTEWPDLFRSPLWSTCRLKRPELHNNTANMESSTSPLLQSCMMPNNNHTFGNNNDAESVFWRPVGQFRQCPVCAPCHSKSSRLTQLCLRRRRRGRIINSADSTNSTVGDDRVQLGHALDLLCGLLRINPDNRYSIHQVIKHPFLSPTHKDAEHEVCEDANCCSNRCTVLFSSTAARVVSQCNDSIMMMLNADDEAQKQQQQPHRHSPFYYGLCETMVIVALKEKLSPYATIVTMDLFVRASEILLTMGNASDCYCCCNNEQGAKPPPCESCRLRKYTMYLMLAVASFLIANQVVCFVESKPFIVQIYRQLIVRMPRFDENSHILLSSIYLKFNNMCNTDEILEEVGVMQRLIVTYCEGCMITSTVSHILTILRQKNIDLSTSLLSSAHMSARLYRYLLVSILESIYRQRTVFMDPQTVDICLQLATNHGSCSTTTLTRSDIKPQHQQKQQIRNRHNFGHTIVLSNCRSEYDRGCCDDNCVFATHVDPIMPWYDLIHHAIQCKSRWTNLKRHWGITT